MTTRSKDTQNMVFDFIERHYYLFLTIIFSVAAFNLFCNLNNIPIDSWDEARHGASAYEMLKNGDYIINTYGNEKDYWNLKPPLSFWAICLGYKLAGFNALGLRLFSAIAASLTILVVTFFSRYRHGRLASLISASVIATTAPYILSHGARTGDADSLYVLFFTTAVVSLAFIEKDIKWLYVSGLSFALAFLTKSWHALNILAVTGIYLLVGKAFLKISLKQWLLYIAASSLPIVLWGAARYSRDGFEFFKMMISFDLLSRSSKPLEGHIGGPNYYLLTLEYDYSHWGIILIGCFTACLFFYRNFPTRDTKNHIFLMGLWISVPLLLYTFAKTKITWYLLPVYPALAVCIGGLSSKVLRVSGSNIVLQLVLCLGIIFSLYKNERAIQIRVMHVLPDRVQQTIHMMGDMREYRSLKIYTIFNNYDEMATYWRQCDLLASELYADLVPMEGGLKAFKKDQETVLLMASKSQKHLDIINELNLKIIIEGDAVFILAK